MLLASLFLAAHLATCHAWAPSLIVRNCATALQAKSRGFGASATSTKKKNKVTEFDTPAIIAESTSIEQILNPRYKEPEVLDNLKSRLRSGQVLILKDAFDPAVSEVVYKELHETDNWKHHEDYQDDGYGFSHSNIFDKKHIPRVTNQLRERIFESEETKEFMTALTGRDCMGDEVSGAPSYYEKGDHSLPHTDHIHQRTVAYIWHLSKNWDPKWGGALYWAQEPLANAYHHASYNTLVLFSVTPHTSHFVTTVSPEAEEKRLAYNGWWHAAWVPTQNDSLEEMLATPEDRLTLTHTQVTAIQDMLDDPWAPRIQPPERHEQIEALRTKIMDELYPPPL